MNRCIVSGLFVLVALALTACPGTAAPVDTSQRILVETGSVLAEIDARVARMAEAQTDAAVERAHSRLEAGECADGEAPGDCVVRLLRGEMETWYNIAAALEASHGFLQTWEEVNDAIRASGDWPDDWADLVCAPFRSTTEMLLALLGEAGVEVPDTWAAIARQSDDLCVLGAAVAAAAGGVR